MLTASIGAGISQQKIGLKNKNKKQNNGTNKKKKKQKKISSVSIRSRKQN
jgi:hypothetical protein